VKAKNFWILFSLFIVPLLFYIFLLTGTNNFAKLPVLTEKVGDIKNFIADDESALSLDGKITILCFLGSDLESSKTNALNLNEKIYKHFHKFTDFQVIAVSPIGNEVAAEKLKEKIAFVTDMSKWKFVFNTPEQIETLFASLKTTYSLNQNSYSEYAFIIDKEMHLRGRTDDEDVANGILYGYSAETVSPIHNKMVDDVKVLVAEYRLALKKYNREI
tara:strand:- start:469698 stop:470348 length:651 start_codon:yes stop_codon:yes gene_type:complete